MTSLTKSRCKVEKTRFKIGDFVFRLENVFDIKSKRKFGKIIEVYSAVDSSGRSYSELYSVEWFDRIEEGFLPHGLTKEEKLDFEEGNE